MHAQSPFVATAAPKRRGEHAKGQRREQGRGRPKEGLLSITIPIVRFITQGHGSSSDMPLPSVGERTCGRNPPPHRLPLSDIRRCRMRNSVRTSCVPCPAVGGPGRPHGVVRSANKKPLVSSGGVAPRPKPKKHEPYPPEAGGHSCPTTAAIRPHPPTASQSFTPQNILSDCRR